MELSLATPDLQTRRLTLNFCRGTSSMKLALNILGFGPTYHMFEVWRFYLPAKSHFPPVLNSGPAHFDFWRRAVACNGAGMELARGCVMTSFADHA